MRELKGSGYLNRHGYVTITPDFKFRASRKLKDDFDNGELSRQ